MKKFDAAQYVQDGGWDFAAIKRTATLGVSDEDQSRLADAYGAEGSAHERELLRYCRTRVRVEDHT